MRDTSILVFNITLLPKEEKLFYFEESVSRLIITDLKNNIIVDQKIPTDVDVKVYDDFFKIDENIKMEFFHGENGIPLRIIFIIILLLIICGFIVLIIRANR